jgi:intracellular sulfur oxidation DsrE/DsrF family protein
MSDVRLSRLWRSHVQSAEGPVAGSQIYRVVMYLISGDEKGQKGMRYNVKKLYDAVGAERLNVEFLAHEASPSLFSTQDTRLAEELARVKTSHGAEYTDCSDTMKVQGLTRADLNDQVDCTIPALMRPMELQEEGWVDIKP